MEEEIKMKQTTPTTINGSWYIVTLNQQQDQPNTALVLAWGRGLFRDYDGHFVPEAKKSLEDMLEIAGLGAVEIDNGS